MKLNCRVCDICGKQMGRRDWQLWFKLPKEGCPNLGMKRLDLCIDCYMEFVCDIRRRKLYDESRQSN